MQSICRRIGLKEGTASREIEKREKVSIVEMFIAGARGGDPVPSREAEEGRGQPYLEKEADATTTRQVAIWGGILTSDAHRVRIVSQGEKKRRFLESRRVWGGAPDSLSKGKKRSEPSRMGECNVSYLRGGCFFLEIGGGRSVIGEPGGGRTLRFFREDRRYSVPSHAG